MQTYLVSDCGHQKYLASNIEPECPLCLERKLRLLELTELLYGENINLIKNQAKDFAQKIMEAEDREDFVSFYKLLHEALYGEGDLNVA